MRNVIAIMSGVAALAAAGVVASPAAALTTGTCNSMQCYASVHTDDAANYPWLATWENAFLSHEADLVNNYDSANMGPYNGHAYGLQFCDATCGSNNPQFELYIGTNDWLQSHNISVDSGHSGYHGDCASPVSAEMDCNGPQNSLGDTGWRGPYAVVQLTHINSECPNNNQWLAEKALGHELDEMMINPYPNYGPFRNKIGPGEASIEVADSVEGNFYMTDNGSDLPDYTSAAYWNPNLPGAVYDRMRILDDPYPAVNNPQMGWCSETGPPPPPPLPTY